MPKTQRDPAREQFWRPAVVEQQTPRTIIRLYHESPRDPGTILPESIVREHRWLIEWRTRHGRKRSLACRPRYSTPFVQEDTIPL